MKYSSKIKLTLLIFVIGFAWNLRASNSGNLDSLKITQIVNDFYEWYIKAIKEKQYPEYKPIFIESENGMTTLDYSKYIENLSKLNFSDSLIFREKQSYEECIRNLKNVKYKDFQKTVFTNIDDYEQVDCDFFNYNRWIGGQESIDGIRITKIDFKTKNCALISIEYYELDPMVNEKFFWGRNTLTMIRLNQKWLIDNIDSWKY